MSVQPWLRLQLMASDSLAFTSLERQLSFVILPKPSVEEYLLHRRLSPLQELFFQQASQAVLDNCFPSDLLLPARQLRAEYWRYSREQASFAQKEKPDSPYCF